MKKIDNPFWKDVLTGFIKTNKNTELEEGISHILKTLYFIIVTFTLIKSMFSGKTGT